MNETHESNAINFIDREIAKYALRIAKCTLEAINMCTLLKQLKSTLYRISIRS